MPLPQAHPDRDGARPDRSARARARDERRAGPALPARARRDPPARPRRARRRAPPGPSRGPRGARRRALPGPSRGPPEGRPGGLRPPAVPRPIGGDMSVLTKRTAEVRGTTMAYIDEGEGRPIVFLHGNPT